MRLTIKPDDATTTQASVLFTVLAAIFLLSGCVSQSKYDALSEQHTALQGERDSLVNQTEQLQQQLNQMEQDLESTRDKLNATNEKLNAATEAVAAKEAHLEEASRKLDDTNSQLKEAEDRLANTRDALDQRTQELEKTSAYVQKTNKLYDNLVSELQSELQANQIKIQEIKDGINVNLSDKILFSSGSAKLNESGVKVITRVSDKLKDMNHQIIVAGFTDDIPIRGQLAKRFPTNWELAAARAASVVKLLEKNGVDRETLLAVSYGETRPVASNDTEDGRSQNRRIEIRLRPKE